VDKKKYSKQCCQYRVASVASSMLAWSGNQNTSLYRLRDVPEVSFQETIMSQSYLAFQIIVLFIFFKIIITFYQACFL